MSGDNCRQVVLRGGRGGKGNQHYATATMQVPKYAQPGQAAQELDVILELKVIADVGLVGFPNVGKSTLISVVSAAKPAIANYHFTTLTPVLGVVRLEEGNSSVTVSYTHLFGIDGLITFLIRQLFGNIGRKGHLADFIKSRKNIFCSGKFNNAVSILLHSEDPSF